ncbi:hypothetical protein F4808DRAFT_362745 [Astrocystis sublimbata]|nr:hypothetical protein F4808DRAFT_362745 [Astrocystis sublimbata]
MANRKPSFILAPTWDLPASPSSPVQLGNVFTSLKTMERPLCRGPKINSEIFTSSKTQFMFSTEKSRTGGFGVFGRLLSMILGIGVDATASWESEDSLRFSFDALETKQFYPDHDYLQACVDTDSVQRYLAKSRYRKPIYIVTGLKIASGAKAESPQARIISGGLSPEVDATTWGGVPMRGGVEVGGASGDRGNVTWETDSSFLFAFRVRRVMVGKRTGQLREDDYAKGTLMDAATETKNGPELIIMEQEIDNQVEGGLVEEILIDDDEFVLFAISPSTIGLDGETSDIARRSQLNRMREEVG